MADIQIWEGDGAACVNGLQGQCGGCRENQCPAPHRLAAHRRRAPYNMGGFFDAMCDEKNADCYAQLVAGDVVWLALIVEDALLSSIRVRVEAEDAANPITYEVVAETIKLDDCTVVGAVTIPAALQGLTTAALDAAWAALAAPAYTDPYAVGGREGIRVGLQLNTIPAGGVLANRARISLVAVASDFEVVGIPNCRDGRCVINNP
jgi:hypothetical protein